VRRFIAIPLPDWLRDELSLLDDDLPAARWTPPDQLHVTLRFIGDMPQGDRHLRSDLHGVRSSGFDMAAAGVGTFPGRGRARVVWAGVDAPPALHQLQRRIERVVRDTGVPPERRRFRPHITLARIGPGVADEAVTRFVLMHTLLRLPPFEVREFCLVGSILRHDGARHHVVETYALDD